MKSKTNLNLNDKLNHLSLNAILDQCKQRRRPQKKHSQAGG